MCLSEPLLPVPLDPFCKLKSLLVSRHVDLLFTLQEDLDSQLWCISYLVFNKNLKEKYPDLDTGS